MYALYSALLVFFLTLTLPYWLVQMMRHGKYRAGLRQRFGAVPAALACRGEKRAIWVHAVSVGEVVAASAVIAALRQKFPFHRVLVSTTTSTGQKLAAQRFGAENVFYFPLDFAFAARPYFTALRPELVVVAETEFWPNFLRLAKRSGARIATINCRISDRSLPGYKRFRFWLPRLLESTLANVDLFLAQTEEDRQRLIEIGAAEAKTAVAGNLKFDVAPPPLPAMVVSLGESFRRSAAAPVLVCGSTLDGEEGPLLSAFRNILANYPKAVMVLAPRHLERPPAGRPAFLRARMTAGSRPLHLVRARLTRHASEPKTALHSGGDGRFRRTDLGIGPGYAAAGSQPSRVTRRRSGWLTCSSPTPASSRSYDRMGSF